MQTTEPRSLVPAPVSPSAAAKPTASATPSTPAAQLLRTAVQDVRQLVELEVALARDEMSRELRDARAAGISLGTAGIVAIVGVTMFVVALALAFSSAGTASLVIGGILLGIAGAAGGVGILIAPKKPLGITRDRLRADVRAVRQKVR